MDKMQFFFCFDRGVRSVSSRGLRGAKRDVRSGPIRRRARRRTRPRDPPPEGQHFPIKYSL
jgi:hypothetical protein